MKRFWVIKSHGRTCVVFCPIVLKHLIRKYVLKVVGALKVVTSSFQHEVKMNYFGRRRRSVGCDLAGGGECFLLEPSFKASYGRSKMLG
jgi:hypothetical protein